MLLFKPIRMIEIITSTDDFFEQQARQGTYKGPGVVLAITGLAFALQHIGTYYALGPGRTRFVSAFTILFTTQLLEPLLLWIVFSMVFYVIASSLGGDILIGRVFRLSGWGFLPLILTGLVWTIARHVVLQSAPVPDFTRGVLQEELNAYGQIVAQHSEALEVVFLVGSIFLLSSIYLWAYAIKKSGTVTTRAAVISAAFPTVVYVLFRVQGILTA